VPFRPELPASDVKGGSGMADNEGPSTDRHNEPVVDPTENVKALNAAANERQDDLRELESRHLREILQLRTDHVQEIRAADAALTSERFAAVQREQALIESHRVELKDDAAKALAAALAAAEKAVSEQNRSSTLAQDRAVAGMKELIVNNAQVSQATTNALSDKLEDVKSSVAVIVNQRLGARERATDQRAVTGTTVALIGLGSAILFGIISAVLTLLLR
jgi:hypothetical protein